MSVTSNCTLPLDPHEQLGQLEDAGSRASDVEASAEPWLLLPTETELYILPDGQVVVADLPVELQSLVSSLGHAVPFEIERLPRDD